MNAIQRKSLINKKFNMMVKVSKENEVEMKVSQKLYQII